MSKNRKTVMLIFVSFVLVLTFCITALLLMYLVQNFPSFEGNSKPFDNSNKEDKEEIVIQEKQELDPFFASIMNDGTVIVFNQEGDSLVIEINDFRWSKIKWSPDNNYLSLIGINNGLENIFLYNIEENLGEWITNFNSENDEIGVKSYLWVDTQNIFYVGGSQNNSWLSRYNIKTKQERFKVKQINGELLEVLEAPTESLVLLQEDFLLLDLEGNTVENLNQLFPSAEEIKSVYFANNNNLVFAEVVNKFNDTIYYSYDLNKKEESSEQILQNVKILCRKSELVIGVRLLPLFSEFRIVSFNAGDKKEDLIYVQQNIDLDKLKEFKCNSTDNVIFSKYLANKEENNIEWNSIKDQKISTIDFLKETKEVVLINNND